MSQKLPVNPNLAQLLWSFQNLPNEYVVVDTETTGLFDDEGAPGLITLGAARVKDGKIEKVLEVKSRPHRELKKEASLINGFDTDEVKAFPHPIERWAEVEAFVSGKLVIMHNAAFDWRLIQDHIQRHQLTQLNVAGVFCSQRAAQPWAEAVGIKCSSRGPSLDSLTEYLAVTDLRENQGNIHYASDDAIQTAGVIHKLKQIAGGELSN
jgi:DNA polymerase-3 subunit epsilon